MDREIGLRCWNEKRQIGSQERWHGEFRSHPAPRHHDFALAGAEGGPAIILFGGLGRKFVTKSQIQRQTGSHFPIFQDVSGMIIVSLRSLRWRETFAGVERQ